MTGADWDALDGALAELRACRTTADLAERACELALDGCRAEAAALGLIDGDEWVPWLRAGRPDLLDDWQLVPRVWLGLGEAGAVERRVAAGGDAQVCDHPAPGGALRTVVAAVRCAEPVLGLLHVVVARDVDAELVESYAAGLGRTMSLVGLLRRAEEQRYVLARMVNGLADPTEPAIELFDTSPGRAAASAGRPSGGAAATGSEAAGPAAAVRDRLTGRQREVLDLMSAGLSNAEIAERIVVSLPTVKSHVRAILRASGAVNRSDAMARLARSGPRVDQPG